MLGRDQSLADRGRAAHFGPEAHHPSGGPADPAAIGVAGGKGGRAAEQGERRVDNRDQRHRQIHLRDEHHRAQPLQRACHHIISRSLPKAAARVLKKATAAARGGRTSGQSQPAP